MFRKNQKPFRAFHLQIEKLEDRPLPSTSPVGTAFVALQNQSFSGVVGSFTPTPGTTYADYAAKVLWGDGQQSTATINSTSHVSGTHTFHSPGAYAVAIQVENIHDLSTNVGIGLGLVESLTSDTELQTPVGVTLTSTATVTQTGADAGGSFSLQETGTLASNLAKLLNPDYSSV